MVVGSNPTGDVPLSWGLVTLQKWPGPFQMLRKIEFVMEWWLAHTPNWMQPKLFWTAYYKTLDTFFVGQHR